jgi:hypothetical protein
MSLVPIDVPGDVAHDEVIDFTLSRSPSAIHIEFITDDDPELNTGDWAIVYGGVDSNNENGRFSYRFRESSRDGDTWHIAPPGGSWNGIKFRLWADESSPEIVIGTPAATLYDPIGQWILAGLDSTIDLTDRSGHGRHLTQTSPPQLTPDVLVGYTSPSKAHYSQADAAFRITGALTITLRAWTYTLDVDQLLIAAAASGEGSSANILFRLGINDTGVGYFSEYGGGNDEYHYFPELTPKLGVWQFYALRRTVDGTITIDLDDESYSQALTPPTGGSSCVLTIGRSLGTLDLNLPWLGGFADVCMWDDRLSDVELAAVRASMSLGG